MAKIVRLIMLFVLRLMARYYTFMASFWENRLMFYRRRRVNANTRLAMFLARKPLPPVWP